MRVLASGTEGLGVAVSEVARSEGVGFELAWSAWADRVWLQELAARISELDLSLGLGLDLEQHELGAAGLGLMTGGLTSGHGASWTSWMSMADSSSKPTRGEKDPPMRLETTDRRTGLIAGEEERHGAQPFVVHGLTLLISLPKGPRVHTEGR